MKARFKAPLEEIRVRAQVTSAAMSELAPQWTAPYFPTPAEFQVLVEEVEALRVESVSASLAASGAGTDCDVLADQLHEASVIVATIGRIRFRGTQQEPVWQRLKANRQSHEAILSAGAQMESAWLVSDAAWVPKPGLTLTDYQALRAAAVAAEGQCTECGNALSMKRGELRERANHLHQLCVDWYAMAMATFPADSPQANLVWRILSPRRSRPEPKAEVEQGAEPVAA